MHRNHTALKALLVAAATLLSTGAWAQHAQGTPQGKVEKAGEKTEKAAHKAGEKAEKAAEKAGEKAEKAAKDSKEALEQSKKTPEERAARKAKEHEAQREKLTATWKGPVNESLRQELRRHAERLARLERIKAVAETEKDKDSVEKATKLLTKENERHDKWMTKNAPVLGAIPATTPAAAANAKEGAR